MYVKPVGKTVVFKMYLNLCLLFLQDWYEVYVNTGAGMRVIEARVERLVRPWLPTIVVITWILLQLVRFALGWVIGALNNIVLIVTWLSKPFVFLRDLVIYWLGLL